MRGLRSCRASISGKPFLFDPAHLARAGFPLLCANLHPTSVAPEALNGLWQPHVLVDRRLRARDGQMVDFRIGLFGTAPPQVLDWDHSRIAGRIAAGDAVAAARAAVRALRADGADLVIGLAHAIGVDPRPLVVAVMVAASASFSTPIGYQTNTLIYGPGGYKFSDFMKVGIPLNLSIGILSALLLPLIWPL